MLQLPFKDTFKSSTFIYALFGCTTSDKALCGSITLRGLKNCMGLNQPTIMMENSIS